MALSRDQMFSGRKVELCENLRRVALFRTTVSSCVTEVFPEPIHFSPEDDCSIFL
jgi:hypothetical protein